MFFFVGQSAQYTSSSLFYWKITFLVIAGANFLYLTVFRKAWRRTEDDDARFNASLADKAWRYCPLQRGSRCCMRVECFRSLESPSRGSRFACPRARKQIDVMGMEAIRHPRISVGGDCRFPLSVRVSFDRRLCYRVHRVHRRQSWDMVSDLRSIDPGIDRSTAP